MERQKQTSFFIDLKTDRNFNLLGAIYGFNHRGETASAALDFISKLQNMDYPPEVKESLSALWETCVNKVKRPKGARSGWVDGSLEHPSLFATDKE